MRDNKSELSTWIDEVDVLHVTLANRSGSALYVAELVAAQAESGMAVGVVLPADFEWLDSLQRLALRIATIPVSHNAHPSFLDSARRAISSSLYIAGILRAAASRQRRLVLHCNFVSPGLSQLIVSRAARRAGIATIITMHDVVPHYMITAPFFAMLDIVSHWLAFRWTDMIHVHTQAQARQLVQLYRLSKTRTIVVPHGIHVPSPGTFDSQREVTPVVFLLIGALRKNKNVREVIDAFVKLAETHDNLRLVIAGRAPRSDQKYWRHCQRIIQSSPTPIEVVDRYLSNDEFGQLISRASCVILPYSSYTSQSGVALQVAKHGIPMIASSPVFLNDAPVSELSSKIMLAAVNTEAILGAMESFISLSAEQRAQIGRTIKTYCVDHFSWQSIVPTFSEIYSHIRHKRTSE